MPQQLAYCTNVHAGADLEQTRENLERHARAVKEAFAPRDPMGIGLWLSAAAARQLHEPHRLAEFAAWLAECGLLPFTLNGFPYGDFHSPIVKHRVYRPTWLESDRVAYTLDLVTILDALLPAGQEGSISTLPIAWGNPAASRDQLLRAADNLEQVVERLATLEGDTGRLIYLCLEPEPGCVLQRSDDVVRYFQDVLGTRGNEARWRRHVRVCHDICHAAVMFEDQRAVVAKYAAQGILIGKIQVSSAVRIDFDALEPDERHRARLALASFAEDRYLHQTCVRSTSHGAVQFFDDLPQALQEPATAGEWRVHFHVPIYLDRFGSIETTRAEISQCLAAVAEHADVQHLEVETYAWSVLPPALRPETLADAIASELRWLTDVLPSCRAPGTSDPR